MGKGRSNRGDPRAKASNARKYQVFISHATADKWLAKILCEKIESIGAKTFRDDRDIKGGDIISDEIFAEIKRSKEFVVLLTPTSVTRPWVLLEVGAACLCRWLRIVPIIYHVGLDPIPAIIQAKKAIQLNDLDTYLEELRERVKGKAV